MIAPPRPVSRPPLILLLAAGLLAAGLLIDAALARPRLRELRRLTERRTEVLLQMARDIERDSRARRLARLLGAEDLAAAYAAYPRGDAPSFIAQALERARLERLELTVGATVAEGRLRRADLQVRARGSYARILDLVRELEQGPRLVRIRTLMIQTEPESATLTAQWSLSVYDIAGEP
ncbi:MAG: hypothetical protein FJY75_13830 [Candidatus Eisenbacteria bacterium]|uniref:Type 4a pilus biogenesis protein PilO n=1 Tax=Eiseniibacteriota bacterium TaxID=2212470 RepID=A0A937XAJ9_UNCEI|nr:hypothetical protein [Candidatus Eisenbacteria bacterium]